VQVIRDLVSTIAPQQFKPSDMPLLESYARATLLERQAYAELESKGPIWCDGRPSPWLVIAEKATRAIVALSARLRLSPQHRSDPKTQPRANVN
jgi:phage terminase small subunit